MILQPINNSSIIEIDYYSARYHINIYNISTMSTAKPATTKAPVTANQGSQENVMKNIRIEKLVLNISVGESGDKLTKGIPPIIQLPRSSKIYPDKSQCSPEPDSQSEVSVSRETKRWLLMLPSEERKPKRFLRED